uniref:Uncharacterized protein n=1 Tax=Caenorhabditis japonica TaxID=281687 RepID=A0A8R1E3P0_CAEJA
MSHTVYKIPFGPVTEFFANRPNGEELVDIESPRRGRGRPPAAAVDSDATGDDEPKPKRGRGRPSSGLVSAKSTPSGKKRGRPAKKAAATEEKVDAGSSGDETEQAVERQSEQQEEEADD